MKYSLAVSSLILLLSLTAPAFALDASPHAMRPARNAARERVRVSPPRWARAQAANRRMVRRPSLRELQSNTRKAVIRPAPLRKIPLPQPQPAIAEPTQPNQTFVPTSPLPNLSARSHLLLLGRQAPVIATIKVTPGDEPVHVRTVTITLTAAASSVASIEVFDDLGYALGVAALDLAASAARDVYTLNLSPERAYFIDHNATIILAARPTLKDEESGGLSGQTVQVENMTVSATGLWSNRTNVVETSGLDFQAHVTANAVLDDVKNGGKKIGTFTTGTHRTIGTFSFAAAQNDDADPALSALTFSVNTPSEVTLSNAILRGNDAPLEHPCTVSSGRITCSAIPASIGSLQAPRTLTLSADVALSSHPNPFLQVTLQNTGTPSSAGDITWTDGDATFTWVPLSPPIAEGTLWE